MKKSIYVPGVFDLIHPGHFNLLWQCRRMAGDGGKLTVAICSDRLCELTKRKPMWDESFRLKMVSLLYIVDEAFVYDDLDQSNHILRVSPNILAIGPEYGGRDEHKKTLETAKKAGARVVVVPRTEDVSTSSIIGRGKYGGDRNI